MTVPWYTLAAMAAGCLITGGAWMFFGGRRTARELAALPQLQRTADTVLRLRIAGPAGMPDRIVTEGTFRHFALIAHYGAHSSPAALELGPVLIADRANVIGSLPHEGSVLHIEILKPGVSTNATGVRTNSNGRTYESSEGTI